MGRRERVEAEVVDEVLFVNLTEVLLTLYGVVLCLPADIDKVDRVGLDLWRTEQGILEMIIKQGGGVVVARLAHDDIVGIARDDAARHLHRLERIGIVARKVGEAQGCTAVSRQGIELGQRAAVDDGRSADDGHAVAQRVGELAARKSHIAVV